MVTKTSPPRSRSLSATIQWVALAVVAVLAVLAAFVFFGEGATGGGGGGGHGLAPITSSTL